MSQSPVIVFFDIGDTLAAPVISQAGKLTGIKPFPYVRDVLRDLSGTCRLGVISNTGSESSQTMKSMLTAAGLDEFLDGKLLLFSSAEGMDKSDPSFFRLGSTRAGAPASRCVYVGEDAAERAVAKGAGFNVSFHPLHALHVVEALG